jgi:hypothetical protein
MKKRESVNAADFVRNVEGGHERRARNIAYRAGGTLVVRGNQVLFSRDGEEELLTAPLQPKSFWRDTWAAMKDRFPDLWP